MGRLHASLVLLSLAVPAWAGSAPVPVGAPFQVNTYTTSYQSHPALSMAADGEFVVVWSGTGSTGGDHDQSSIQGRGFTADGSPVGSQFQVNTYGTSSQVDPAISGAGDGSFTVVWESWGSSGGDTSFSSIHGRRYTAAGVALGGEFQVNSYTTGIQDRAAVSVAADGAFVVAWEGFGSSGGDNSFTSVHGQRYSSAGAALGGEFQINTSTTNNQEGPTVATDAQGGFVVTWKSDSSNGGDTSFASIQGQRYSAGGTAVGGEFQVNSYTTGFQVQPAIAWNPADEFVIVWSSNGSSGGDTSSYSIQAQRYAADGTSEAEQFQVNAYSPNVQRLPAVSSDSDGDFVVVWESYLSYGSYASFAGIHGQRYAAGGVALGGEFQVNSLTTFYQTEPKVSLDSAGDFVVVWTKFAAPPGGGSWTSSLQGQRFRVTGTLTGKVFFDGDGNGLQTGAEAGIPGVLVELYDSTLSLRRTAVTDSAGEYHLRPKEGSWHLRFVAPPSYFTTPNVGSDDTIDSDAIPASGETAPFSVTVNVLDTTIDAGFVVLPLFSDGFESGNTVRWSAAIP